jgi:hypothetical protein
MRWASIAISWPSPTRGLTQGICEVCAVPTGSVLEAVRSLPHRPEVVPLDAHISDPPSAEILAPWP